MDSIVTLTMNPALDITTDADVVRPTDKVRCTSVRYDPGGGGVNVALVAHNLGASVTAVFPAGGATGDVYGDLLTARGVPFHRVKIARSTRESFTIDEISTGLQYRFVLPGPSLTFAELQQCLVELRRLATSAKFVVASGSLPPGAPANFYQQVALVCRDLGARLILDTSGGGLRHLTSGVFLLKASVRELRECGGREQRLAAVQVGAFRYRRRRGNGANARHRPVYTGRRREAFRGCRRARGYRCRVRVIRSTPPSIDSNKGSAE